MQQDYLKTLQYCQQKYQTILPHQDMKFALIQSHQIIQAFVQYEILVQLLIQNVLFCQSEFIREKSLQLLESLEKPDLTQHYNIDLFQFSDNHTNLELSPLQNTFQIPLLKVYKQITEYINNSYQDKMSFLKKFTPLIQLSYIPQPYQKNQMRCKFSTVDEDLLLQGLQKHGSKQLEAIQQEFLWGKTLKQIKNKYKNSICRNASANKIKAWKLSQYDYMSQTEIQQFSKGIQWFGREKCQLIHKYFVTTRTTDFLNNELNKNQQLAKKRKKHNISDQYPNYYEQLWNQDRKKIQLNPVDKEQQSSFDNFFNLNHEYSNSFCRSNFDFSRLGFNTQFSVQVQQNSQVEPSPIPSQQKVQPTYQVWKNVISALKDSL